jgi:hypothetical protein
MSMIGKVKGRSFEEARVRSVQTLTSFGERRGLFGAASLPDDASFLSQFRAPLRSAGALLDSFRSEASSTPVPGLRDLAATAAALPHASLPQIIADADAILHNRFSLFGGQEFDFGNPVDWHLEPRAGRVVPRHHWSQIDFLDPLVAGDKKIIWELNRQQYLLTLGRAYARTRDERYAAIFLKHLEAWMAENPPKFGINWASALEVAYRSIAWLWALMFFRSSPSLTPQVFLPILKQLTVNGRHIETYLSFFFSPNTHLTGEALGLYCLGTLVPFLPEAQRWRTTGRAILLQQLPKQVRDDGTYFENATYYHRYTLDIYLYFTVLAGGRGEPLDPSSLARIESLAAALMVLIKPDGTHGFFGDDDGGRLLPLDASAPNDFRSALCNAAVFFDRADCKAAAGNLAEETIWLLGPTARARYAGLPNIPRPSGSCTLRDGGLFVMRDGGGYTANQLIIDCGPHGALNCGHAHADALAFELAAHGRSILMDAGTFTYTGTHEARRRFRGTECHNAFTVDGLSSSEPAGPFSWASVARCQLLDWRSSDRFDVFEGEHDGFQRLAAPVSYKRSLVFIKGSYWILRDRAASAGVHDFAQHFLFSPDATPRLVPQTIKAGGTICCEQTPGEAGLDIVTFSDCGTWALEDGWVSSRYADRRIAKTAVFVVSAADSADLITFLVPRAADGKADLPTQVAAEGGRAFMLHHSGDKGWADLFLVRREAVVATAELKTDAAWLWLRRQEIRPVELIMKSGSWIEFEGEMILRSQSSFTLTLRREVDELVMETEAPTDFELASLGCLSVVIAGQRIATGNKTILRFAGGSLVQ